MVERDSSLHNWLKIAVLAMAAGAPAIAEAAPMSLAAHRAVYDISLLDIDDGVDISTISGRLVLEFT
ncbi:EipB family protein, partial [Bauldia litoralis]|uniref:EipB family protein n=1 Tax=Bauldia litoralis TaxID=665467 RepID=UPI0032646A48